MDREHARDILRLYRPGTTDALDPQIAEALEVARADAELAHWLDEQCVVYTAIRSKLKHIQPPADLKRKILIENVGRKKVIHLRQPVLFAAAAAVLLLGAGLWMLLANHTDTSYASYLERMTGKVRRPYAMSMTSTNLADIRAYLQAHQWHSDYTLSKNLEKLPGEGCATITWHEKRVSLVCIDGGKTHDGKPRDLWLFVANRSDISDAPASNRPHFEQVHGLTTASWADGNKLYVLAAFADESELSAYLD
jgi:hypothetical protein